MDRKMNEFTKGELLTIHLDMTIYANKASPLKESPVHKELRDKVQRMIDNYCEHKCKANGECLMNVCERCARMT